MLFWQRAWPVLLNLLSRSVRALALSLLYFYQSFLRSWLNASCRFTPTCSQYAVEAFQQQPPHIAFYLTGRRLCRCHPWGPFGLDPVPTRLKETSQT